jgi:hypothetical protein
VDPTGLPTDNLYKFLALAGLAFAGFCAWLFARLYWHRSRSVQELEIERSRQKVALESATGLWESFNQQGDLYLEGMREAKTDEGRTFYRGLLLEKQAEMLAESRTMNAITEEARVVNEKLEKMVEDQPLVLKVRKSLGTAIVFGMLVSGVGFAQWWRHLQRYTDTQAQAEFNDKMRELGIRQRAWDAQCWKDQHAKPPVPVPSTCPYP